MGRREDKASGQRKEKQAQVNTDSFVCMFLVDRPAFIDTEFTGV